MAKPRGRKSRVTSREEISSSSSGNESNSENGSESDPILDLIEESNLMESPSEILPDPLEVLPENYYPAHINQFGPTLEKTIVPLGLVKTD